MSTRLGDDDCKDKVRNGDDVDLNERCNPVPTCFDSLDLQAGNKKSLFLRLTIMGGLWLAVVFNSAL